MSNMGNEGLPSAHARLAGSRAALNVEVFHDSGRCPAS